MQSCVKQTRPVEQMHSAFAQNGFASPSLLGHPKRETLVQSLHKRINQLTHRSNLITLTRLLFAGDACASRDGGEEQNLVNPLNLRFYLRMHVRPGLLTTRCVPLLPDSRRTCRPYSE
jgi:hypothetical protein